MTGLEIDLATFRVTVDACGSGAAAHAGSLQSLYDYVGLPPAGNMSTFEVHKVLESAVKAAFKSEPLLVRQAFLRLRRQLVNEHVLLDRKLEPYASVCDFIIDMVREKALPPTSDNDDWETAILHAFDHVQLQPSPFSLQRERFLPREYAIARAARRLRDAGFGLTISEAEISLSEESDERLITEIERLVAVIGGINLARRIFAALTPSYYPRQERYHVINPASPTGGGSPSIPFGYLLLLAEKFPHGRRPVENTDVNFGRLMRLSIDYASLLDAQDYHSTFLRPSDPKLALEQLPKTALHDTLFRFPQMRGSDVVEILKGSLDFVEPERKIEGFSLSEISYVIGAALERARNTRGPVLLLANHISRTKGDIDKKTIQGVMDRVLSHPRVGANQRFRRPRDASPNSVDVAQRLNPDFSRRPLLQGYSAGLYLLDRALCAPACLEAVYGPLRNSIAQFDDKVGKSIERFLRRVLMEKGIPSATGHYVSRGLLGECDVIVETSEVIFLIEIKKKALTTLSRAGSTAHLLIDLAESMLKAQVQAGWHELALKRDGLLELNYEGATRRIVLQDRSVERIALSLFDFGSFQNRSLVFNFFESFFNSSLSVNSVDFEEKFDSINNLLREIQTQLLELYPGERDYRQPFFNCWFLSLPQIMVILDDAKGVEDFKRAIWSTRHIETGGNDFYHAFAYMQDLPQRAREEAERKERQN